MGLKHVGKEVKEGKGMIGIVVAVTLTILVVVPAVMWAYTAIKTKFFPAAAPAA